MSRFAKGAMDAVYQSKARGHEQLARQSFEEKIEALVRLQQRALDIAVATGRKPNRVWKLRSKS